MSDLTTVSRYVMYEEESYIYIYMHVCRHESNLYVLAISQMNRDFQNACVRNVLDSVVDSLLRDPNRKFVFAEMVKHCFT